MTSFFWYSDLKWIHLKMLMFFGGCGFFGPKWPSFGAKRGVFQKPSSHADSTIGATRSPWGSEWSFLVPFIGGKVAYIHPYWQYIPLIYPLIIIPLTTIDVSQFFGGRKFLENFWMFFSKMRWEIRHLEEFGGSALTLQIIGKLMTLSAFKILWHSRFYGIFCNSGYVRLKHPQQHVDYHRVSWILWPKHPCYAAAKTVAAAVSFGGSKQIPVVPGQAGGGSFQKEKNYIAQKEFAYRMCARRPTSAMPKSFLCCERAFCRSMVVMFCALKWSVLMSWYLLRGLVMWWSRHLMRCNGLCCVMSRDAMRCHGDELYYKVLLCTTKYYSNTTPYYKYYSVLLQYYPVLRSTTEVLLCTTPVLPCTTKYYSSTNLYYKVLLQY